MEIPEHIRADAQLFGKSHKELTTPRSTGITRRELLGLSRLSILPQHQSETETSPRFKKILISSLAALGLLGFGAREVGEAEICADVDIECISQFDDEMTFGTLQTEAAVVPPVETTIVPTTTETTVPITLPPPPPTTVPVTVPGVAITAASNPERSSAAPETIGAIEAMSLSVEGYQNFFNTIDQTWFDFAQGYQNFNPNSVEIAQTPTEWVTAHYTASYTNPDGSGTEPIGNMAVDRLIDFMANRSQTTPCCAINFIIDRNGHPFQAAPYWAKLQHDPPNNGRTVGFEIEAAFQEQISTIQYEAASYLTIAILQNEGLLGTNSLTELFKGHGDMRDTYREHNPSTELHERNDFDASVMAALVPKLENFITATPNIPELTQPLR